MSLSWQVASGRVLAVLSAVVLACSALAACGSNANGPGAGGGDLCSNVGQVDHLVVKRVNLIRRNHPHFTFPAKVTVSDPAKARSVAHAVCALPPMPSGTLSCGIDTLIMYQLTFSAGGRKLALVSVKATGCGDVRGLGQTRWTARSPGFCRVLGTAMGIAQSGDSTFSGMTG
jgi:predicted small secreted protein